MTDRTVDERTVGIDRLIAESDIRNLVGRIAHLADDGDLAEYITLFTDDATWSHVTDGTVLSGRSQLLAGAEQRRRDGIQGPGTGTRHVNTTLWISLDSPDQARAQSYFLYLGTRGTDQPVILTTGRYLDKFRRTEQGWRLAERVILNEVN